MKEAEMAVSPLGFLVAAVIGLAASSSSVQAQSGAGTAPPEGMPAEIAAMFGAAGSGDVAVAPPEPQALQQMAPQYQPPQSPQQLVPPQQPAPRSTLAGTKYLFTTLRVVNNGNSRGCNYADWNCMANLCKSDLQDNAAWRGWGGCWREGNNYICYFECGQARSAF
jgi:hypothetical protein